MAPAARTSLDKDEIEESMVGWVMPMSKTVAPSSKRPYVVSRGLGGDLGEYAQNVVDPGR